jgi:hypothetical protein
MPVFNNQINYMRYKWISIPRKICYLVFSGIGFSIQILFFSSFRSTMVAIESTTFTFLLLLSLAFSNAQELPTDLREELLFSNNDNLGNRGSFDVIVTPIPIDVRFNFCFKSLVHFIKNKSHLISTAKCSNICTSQKTGHLHLYSLP